MARRRQAKPAHPDYLAGQQAQAERDRVARECATLLRDGKIQDLVRLVGKHREYFQVLAQDESVTLAYYEKGHQDAEVALCWARAPDALRVPVRHLAQQAGVSTAEIRQQLHHLVQVLGGVLTADQRRAANARGAPDTLRRMLVEAEAGRPVVTLAQLGGDDNRNAVRGLMKENLVARVTRGRYQLTDDGRRVAEQQREARDQGRRS